MKWGNGEVVYFIDFWATLKSFHGEKNSLISQDSPVLQECVSAYVKTNNEREINKNCWIRELVKKVLWIRVNSSRYVKKKNYGTRTSVFSEGCVRTVTDQPYDILPCDLVTPLEHNYKVLTIHPSYCTSLLAPESIQLSTHQLPDFLLSGLNHRPQLNWIKRHTITNMYRWQIRQERSFTYFFPHSKFRFLLNENHTAFILTMVNSVKYKTYFF